MTYALLRVKQLVGTCGILHMELSSGLSDDLGGGGAIGGRSKREGYMYTYS